MEKMICHICGSEMDLTKEKLELIEGTSWYEELEVFKCQKCNEIVLTDRQMKTYRSIVDKFRIRRKLVASGNAIVLRIPNDLQAYYQINPNTEVDIIPIDRKRFIIEVQHD